MPALAMLPAVAGAGLIAHHLARLTVLPRADPFAAALAATLVAAATLPGLGVAALIVPQLLALPALAGPRRDRVVALLVQCIAILAAMGRGRQCGGALVRICNNARRSRVFAATSLFGRGKRQSLYGTGRTVFAAAASTMLC